MKLDTSEKELFPEVYENCFRALSLYQTIDLNKFLYKQSHWRLSACKEKIQLFDQSIWRISSISCVIYSTLFF